jgi:hypothetical protein
LRSKDNNASLFSTTDINQEVAVKNAGGDTTSKITKKYSVYTDPITEAKSWSLFLNFYLISLNNSTALHIYPTYNIFDEGKNNFNTGIGYVISLKNSKKDAPVINAEGYVEFQDVFNELNSASPFIKRNEIGIRFTLPFNFL